MIAPVEQNRISSHYEGNVTAHLPVRVSDENDSLQKIRNTIGDYPVVTLAVATAVGAAVGWLIKRGVRL